jgi:hypothetical protein
LDSAGEECRRRRRPGQEADFEFYLSRSERQRPWEG